MALVKFLHHGNAVDYKPVADVAAGDVVVLNDLVGVANSPIKANILGSLAVAGVFEFPKTAGAGTAITAGTKLYWDAVAKVATATVGANKFIGKATADAADASTTVRARMSQ
jgi:predicted RecA/RadA family phage recombinase